MSPVSAPPEAATASAASPQKAERAARTRNSRRSARARMTTAALPEIIAPKGQLAAALQLSAAISSGQVDGNQLLAAQQDYEKRLEVKLIEIASLDSLAPSETAEQSE